MYPVRTGFTGGGFSWFSHLFGRVLGWYPYSTETTSSLIFHISVSLDLNKLFSYSSQPLVLHLC